MRALPADGPGPGRRPPAGRAAEPGGALEVRGGDAGQVAGDQVRADDREPGVSLHLQLLHRFDGRLPAARLRGAERGPGVPAHQGAGPDRRLARPQLRGPVRRLHGRDRGGGAAGADAPHRREQPLAAVGAAPPAPAPERLPGDPAGDRVVVRAGQQVEDPAHRDGQGPPVRRAREPAAALRPLRPDQLRAGAGQRRGAGAVRADQEVHRPRARGLPGLLAAVGLRPGGADEPGLPARRPGAPVPVHLPEQQPRDERPAGELLVGGVLRPAGGSDQLLVLLAGDRPAAGRHPRRRSPAG